MRCGVLLPTLAAQKAARRRWGTRRYFEVEYPVQDLADVHLTLHG